MRARLHWLLFAVVLGLSVVSAFAYPTTGWSFLCGYGQSVTLASRVWIGAGNQGGLNYPGAGTDLGYTFSVQGPGAFTCSGPGGCFQSSVDVPAAAPTSGSVDTPLDYATHVGLFVLVSGCVMCFGVGVIAGQQR